MYVCLYVCMYVCMYVCVCVFVCCYMSTNLKLAAALWRLQKHVTACWMVLLVSHMEMGHGFQRAAIQCPLISHAPVICFQPASIF